ncbi:MAG: hypothetical protein F2667_12050 [Actinobacteria bacterium]|uniref:Unannotated protein n=1 Tax=freshwater metagenome TaxID=449393 RepID=A0A6J6RUI0_9ZZZZ|nr:hypothetical protein [Actinomycetota bacterium]
MTTVRNRTAQVVWGLCAVLAMVLALAAALVAVDAPTSNAIVGTVRDLADAVDLGIFSRRDGIIDLDVDNPAKTNALANWGLGALAYLVVGRLVDRVVRP